MREVEIVGKKVGDEHPCYVLAEIGINHNGDLDLAKRLVDAAVQAGCNAVKFQKRTPELCVPEAQRQVMRETPWGIMPYIEYRHRVEFSEDEYDAIDKHCRENAIPWFASCWDLPSLQFFRRFNPPAYKIPSALITDMELLSACRETGKPLIMSTGMSTMEQIRKAVEVVGQERLVLCHCTSTYPCPPAELNLRMITTLRDEFNCPIGYSGHEVGLQTTTAAAVLGACLIERHITLDRSMWGSDQAASVEPHGLARLVRDIRVIETAMGDGRKRVYESEHAVRRKLRPVSTLEPRPGPE